MLIKVIPILFYKNYNFVKLYMNQWGSAVTTSATSATWILYPTSFHSSIIVLGTLAGYTTYNIQPVVRTQLQTANAFSFFFNGLSVTGCGIYWIAIGV